MLRPDLKTRFIAVMLLCLLLCACRAASPENSEPDTRDVPLGNGRHVTLKFVRQTAPSQNTIYESVDVYRNGQKCQTLKEIGVWRPEDDDAYADLNFDGFPDLKLPRGLSGTSGPTYLCYLWDDGKSLFEPCEALGKLNFLEADSQSKTISAVTRWEPGYYISRTFFWQENALEISQIRIEHIKSGRFPDFWDLVVFQKKDGAFQLETACRWPAQDTAENNTPWIEPGRPAYAYESPAFAYLQLETLVWLTGYARAYEKEKTENSHPLYAALLDLVYRHNTQFLQAGGGIGSSDLAQLRRAFATPAGYNWDKQNCGRFARYADMQEAARYLFGEDIPLPPIHKNSGEYSEYGDNKFYTESINPTNIGIYIPIVYEIPVSVTRQGDKTLLETMRCKIAAGRILYDNSYSHGGHALGYLAEDGTPYFYEDAVLDNLPHFVYTFQQAQDGHFYLASPSASKSA